jgi:hypothetical protein
MNTEKLVNEVIINSKINSILFFNRPESFWNMMRENIKKQDKLKRRKR